MLTLLISTVSSSLIQTIGGYIIMSLEAAYVILNIVCCFVNPDSKVGKVLSKICLGLNNIISHQFSKDETIEEEKNKDDDDQ